MYQYVRGHKCTLTEKQELPYFTTKTASKAKRLQSWWFEKCTVSTSNSNCFEFLPSMLAYRKEVERHYNNYRGVIHPLSQFAKYWDIFILLMSVLNVIVYPLYCGFRSITRIFPAISYFALFLDCVCVIDIILIFKTGYLDVERRHIELDSKKIAKHFLKTSFVFHLVSCLPIQFISIAAIGLTHYYGGILVFVKLYHLIRIRTYITRFCTINDVRPNVTTLIKTGVTFFLVTQWFIAFVHYISEFNTYILGNTETWFERAKGLIPAGFRHEYTVCFYHAMSLTMNMTTGFIPPKCLTDMFIAICISLLGHFLVYSTFTTFTYIALSAMNTKFDETEALSEIEEYMKHKMLALPLQKRVKLFYNQRISHHYNDDDLLGKVVPKYLHEELKYHKNRQLLQNIPLFQQIPTELFEKILPSLEAEVYLPGDVIIEENTEDSNMYCLLVGTVAMYIAAVGEICHLQKGSVFGECELLLRGVPRMSSTVALEVCVVTKLEGMEFAKHIAAVNRDLYKVIVDTALSHTDTEVEVENKLKQLLEINKQ